jgi:acyl-CoA synthetase (AMP-forming)/AMP-acid ligase II
MYSLLLQLAAVTSVRVLVGLQFRLTVAFRSFPADHSSWSSDACLTPLIQTALRYGRHTQQQLLDYLSDEVAKWWLPDGIVFVDEIPHIATGKIQKTKLRERFGDHALGDQ